MTAQGSTSPYPILPNGDLYDQAQVERYFAMLFGTVDWQPGQCTSILGIGEKGTPREGLFRERQLLAPAFMGAVHGHLKRWAQWHAAGFIVPAVLKPSAAHKGEAKLDDVAALTAIILDIDSGDVTEKAKYVQDRLGRATMVVASGGKTEAGKFKAHLYWCFNEPCEDVERVAAIRKLLAAKVGGDQSFGRATQVVRIPGSVHAKNGQPSLCRILDQCDAEYDFEELADIIEGMPAMPGLPADKPAAQLPGLGMGGMMDFSPRQDTAMAALHRDIAAGGEEMTRWGEFNKVAGFHIREAREGRMTLQAAYEATNGWMLTHMDPPWPAQRFEQEFRGMFDHDLAANGPFPQSSSVRVEAMAGTMMSNPAAELPFEFFGDIQASLTNAWRVRDLLPLAGLGLIYGSPGAGKSFFAVDVALRIAAGMEVDGRTVHSCTVIYIAAEGQRGLRNRIAAWRQKYGIEGDLPFALIPCAVNLLDPCADLSRLIAGIHAQMERLGGVPGLIVVDTLAATFGGGDENTSDMLAYVNNVAKLRDEFDALAVAVHHRPKDVQNDTPRGHGSLMGAMDTIIRVDGDQVRSATVTKQKDGEGGQVHSFQLEVITLGVDEEGQPVTSAVVKYEAARPVKKKLSGAAARGLEALRTACAAHGVPAVREDAWREKWVGQLSDEQQAKPDTLRKAWSRIKKTLRDAGEVTMEHDLWAVAQPVPDDGPMDFSGSAGAGD